MILRRISAALVGIGFFVFAVWMLSSQLRSWDEKAFDLGVCTTKCGEAKPFVEKRQCYCTVEKK